MNEKYDIVVVVISFNRLKLLKQTIKSLKDNTVMRVKIIVVDNSKNTETPKYLRTLKDVIYYRFPKLDDAYEFAEHVTADTEIGRALALGEGTVYWDNRMTVGKSYMKGAELAPPSDYILFVQNDIYFLPGWDKLMTNTLDRYEDIILLSGYSGGPGSIEERPVEDDTRMVRDAGKVPGSNMMFRRKDWEEIGAFPDYDEDNWICAELKTRYGKTVQLIYPYILIHCGYTSTLVGGMEAEKTLTSDWQGIDILRPQYPDILFE